MKEETYCKELRFKDQEKRPLIGLVTNEDSNYVYFRTRKKTYQISHSVIESIASTDIVFMGDPDV